MGDDVLDQQLGCHWSKNHVVSISLSGCLNFLDPLTSGSVTLVVQGHNKPITSLCRGREEHTLITGDSEGRLCVWNSEKGMAAQAKGE